VGRSSGLGRGIGLLNSRLHEQEPPAATPSRRAGCYAIPGGLGGYPCPAGLGGVSFDSRFGAFQRARQKEHFQPGCGPPPRAGTEQCLQELGQLFLAGALRPPKGRLIDRNDHLRIWGLSERYGSGSYRLLGLSGRSIRTCRSGFFGSTRRRPLRWALPCLRLRRSQPLKRQNRVVNQIEFSAKFNNYSLYVHKMSFPEPGC
jgi:hypothetical protein